MVEKKATLLIQLRDEVSKGLGSVGTALKSLAKQALVVGAAVTAVGAAAYKCLIEWGKQREAVAKLDTALANLQNVQAGASTRLQELAKSLQKTTTFSDETIISAETLLATYGLSEAAITKLIPGLLDMATKTGDLEGAAWSVGKAIATGETGKLNQLGIVVDETKFKTDALGAVTDELKEHYNGMAKAIAGEPLGKIQQMKNTMSELMETVGSFIADPAVRFIDWLKENVGHLAENRIQIGKIVNYVLYWGQTTAQVIDFMIDSLKTLGTYLGDIAYGWYLLFTGHPILAVEQFKTAVIDASSSIKDNFVEIILDIDAAHTTMIEANAKLVADDAATKAKLATAQEMSVKTIKKGEISLRLFRTREEMLKRASDWTSYEDWVALQQKKKQDTLDTLNFIATMSTSKNKELAVIGKASAIAMATIDTHKAAVKALASTVPPWNYILMAAVIAAGMVQVAQISAVKLAQGGIVLPQAGGVPAVLGEAGRAEAVIPLESPEAGQMIGQPITININAGVIVADDYTLREFAKRIDEQLFKLRHNRETWS